MNVRLRCSRIIRSSIFEPFSCAISERQIFQPLDWYTEHPILSSLPLPLLLLGFLQTPFRGLLTKLLSRLSFSKLEDVVSQLGGCFSRAKALLGPNCCPRSTLTDCDHKKTSVLIAKRLCSRRMIVGKMVQLADPLIQGQMPIWVHEVGFSESTPEK